MQSITIHGLDERLAKELKKIAQHEKQSMNKIVKKVLEKGLGLADGKKDHRSDFLDVFAAWSQADETEFNHAITELEMIYCFG